MNREKYFRGEAIVTLSDAHNNHRRPWTGRVSFRASYWPAKTLTPYKLSEGDVCEVIGHDNITVILRPIR